MPKFRDIPTKYKSQLICQIEGIIPALETSHAIAYAFQLAKTLPKDKTILVNLSGRGDKDMHTVALADKLKLSPA